jgi:hypothetical protein
VSEEKVYFFFRAKEIYPISEHNTKQKAIFFVFIVKREYLRAKLKDTNK